MMLYASNEKFREICTIPQTMGVPSLKKLYLKKIKRSNLMFLSSVSIYVCRLPYTLPYVPTLPMKIKEGENP